MAQAGTALPGAATAALAAEAGFVPALAVGAMGVVGVRVTAASEDTVGVGMGRALVGAVTDGATVEALERVVTLKGW